MLAFTPVLGGKRLSAKLNVSKNDFKFAAL
jgi:hypothetical protein